MLLTLLCLFTISNQRWFFRQFARRCTPIILLAFEAILKEKLEVVNFVIHYLLLNSDFSVLLSWRREWLGSLTTTHTVFKVSELTVVDSLYITTAVILSHDAFLTCRILIRVEKRGVWRPLHLTTTADALTAREWSIWLIIFRLSSTWSSQLLQSWRSGLLVK